MPKRPRRPKTIQDTRCFATMVAAHQGWKLIADREFLDTLIAGLTTNHGRYGYYLCPCRDTLGSREADSGVICPCEYARRTSRSTATASAPSTKAPPSRRRVGSLGGSRSAARGVDGAQPRYMAAQSLPGAPRPRGMDPGSRPTACRSHRPCGSAVRPSIRLLHRVPDGKWARLIAKLYEADPLTCRRCGSSMHADLRSAYQSFRESLLPPGQPVPQSQLVPAAGLLVQSRMTGQPSY